jgi:GTP cyclohydrolase IIa
VTNTQVALVQLDNYGPWTVTPEPRPEMNLQALQASVYADLAKLVGAREGYAFYGRFDNMLAVTNGLDADDHARIQASLNDRYPTTASVTVGVAERPADALAAATDRLQAAGSAQDGDRRAVLEGEYLAESRPDDLRVAHFDVVDATGTYTDAVDAYEADLAIRSAVVELGRHLKRAHGGLVQFVGGDNAVAVCPALSGSAFEGVVAHVREETGVELQVGVGDGATAAEAGMAAKHALERCRENGDRVAGASPPVASD